MKISAKAKDYRIDKSIFFGVYRDIDEGDLEDAFIDGAQWMFEKAVNWLKEKPRTTMRTHQCTTIVGMTMNR